MKRKRHGISSDFGFHRLPWDVVLQTVSFFNQPLSAFAILQQLSWRWYDLVQRHLASDEVLRTMLPAPLGQVSSQLASLLAWVSDSEKQTLRMAACSERLFRMLNADQWLRHIRTTICTAYAYQYKIPKEVCLLLSSHKHEQLILSADALYKHTPHLQLAHLLRQWRLSELCRELPYAVARPWTENSLCGRVYIHRPITVVDDNAPFVRCSDKTGSVVYLTHLNPLMDGKRGGGEQCYELRVPSRTGHSKTHLQTGHDFLASLDRHFRRLYPLVKEMGAAFVALNKRNK